MSKGYLDQAYELASVGQTMGLYKGWAETYDEEIAENGYASPRRTAHALLESGAKPGSPLLDIGCGTGVSGLFLRDAGFTDLHGSDFSAEMLQLAADKKLYKNLYNANLHKPFDFVETAYQTITAIGVLAPGHAEPGIIQSVTDLLPPGGYFGFSMNDHTLDNPGYEFEISRLVRERAVRIRWRDYGDHLPGIDLQSMIVVLEKL